MFLKLGWAVKINVIHTKNANEIKIEKSLKAIK